MGPEEQYVPNYVEIEDDFIGKEGLSKIELAATLLEPTDIGQYTLTDDKQISKETLNHMIEEGLDKGESVALWLARSPEGRDLLAHNDFALGSQISKETLNHMIEEGPNKGQSVAYWLAGSLEGPALLAYDDFALGSQITAETLNHILEGKRKGVSVAFWLAGRPEGRALLVHDDFALGSQITAETLNHIIPEGIRKELSVAFWLTATPEGLALLAHDNYKLGKQLSTVGKTIADILERNQETMLSRLYSMFTKPRRTPSAAHTPRRLSIF
ncbi:MAG: hypothetical protein VX737_00450 [Pseudomonadota bacterium]|nr:hypothetical protein [Pseudomonadota bacterium]